MDDSKYITNNLDVVVFPNHIDHSHMARLVEWPKDSIVGAGFVSFDMYGNPHCYGQSLSLNKKIDPSDVDVINRLILNRSPFGSAVTAEEYHAEESIKATCWVTIEDRLMRGDFESSEDLGNSLLKLIAEIRTSALNQQTITQEENDGNTQ